MRRNRRAPRRTDGDTTGAERRVDEDGTGTSAGRTPGTGPASSGVPSPTDTGTDAGVAAAAAPADPVPARPGPAASAPAAASAPTGQSVPGAALADGPATADATEATATAAADAAPAGRDEIPPGQGPRTPGGMDALWTSPDGPEGPMGLRVRVPRTDPMSVLMTSFLVSTGLMVCAAVTMPPLWIVLTLLGEELWLPPLWQLALGIVAVLAVTVFATLCALCYNLSARCGGGVRVALAEALPDTAPPEPGEDRDPEPEPATAGPTGP
ncbi:DUF3566 domain-containing protein [Streptomyces sp. NPDC093260]|uniref:DUF3566 domain-containing protein n=1 Tax=Streptomyces sp. NPDC093260 TaxID=3155073 RepID=UPI003445CB8D